MRQCQLAKVEPVSDGSSPPEIVCLRKGKKKPAEQRTCSWGEELEYVKETILRTPMLVKKVGQEMPQAPKQESLCSPWWRSQWGHLCPCSQCRVEMVEKIGGKDFPPHPWRTPCWSKQMPSGCYDHLQSPHWSKQPNAGTDFLAALVTP